KTVAVAQKAATAINRITTTTDNGQISATIESDGQLAYKTFSLHNPERVVMDLANVRNAIAEKVIEVSSSRLARIRLGIQEQKGVRIVFDVKDPSVFQVKPQATTLFIVLNNSKKSNQKTKLEKKRAEPKKALSVPPVAPPDSSGIGVGS